MAVGAIGGLARGQIHRRDRVDHKPREVILGQPLAQARRQQQLLLAITRQEVLRHAWHRLNRAGQTSGHSGGHRGNHGSGANGRSSAERRRSSPSSRTSTTGARSLAHAMAASTLSNGS
jgi:hypothetical protein